MRTLGRVLAGLICVVGFTFAPGCSQSKCCGKDGQCCKKKCDKACAKDCDKAGCKKAAGKCPAGCTKPCCKKA
ncbi:MAG: hypothetical protein H6817_08335 [Phycisphaerales bacterium]|nr:hypothetical protein [Phycisphaerales bacterium]